VSVSPRRFLNSSEEGTVRQRRGTKVPAQFSPPSVCKLDLARMEGSNYWVGGGQQEG